MQPRGGLAQAAAVGDRHDQFEMPHFQTHAADVIAECNRANTLGNLA
jgi:hypothetical protein